MKNKFFLCVFFIIKKIVHITILKIFKFIIILNQLRSAMCSMTTHMGTHVQEKKTTTTDLLLPY